MSRATEAVQAGTGGLKDAPAVPFSVKVCALAAWVTGLASVVQGLVTLIHGSPTSNKPPEAAFILAYGLYWIGLGIVLFKTRKLSVISLAAFSALLTFVLALLLGPWSVLKASVGKWGLVLWAALLNTACAVAFVQLGAKRTSAPDALPSGSALKAAQLAAAAQVYCLRNTMAIAWRELKRYFRSPSSYIILALFLLYQGLIFYIVVRYLNDPRAPHGAPMKFFFGGPFWFWPLECFIIAIITMDTLADEQIRRTMEPLMTTPVHEAELVIGKFLGALGFFFFLWVWTFVYVLMMVCHVQTVSAAPIVLLGLCGGWGAMWAILLVASRRAAFSGITAWVVTALAGFITAWWKGSVSFVAVMKLMGVLALPVAGAGVLRWVDLKSQALRFVVGLLTAAGLVLVAWYGYGFVKTIFQQAGPSAPNMGPIVSGYLGALLIGAAGISLGILFSSLTRDLKLACMLTFVSLFLLIIVKIMLMPDVNIIDTKWIRDLMTHLNFFDYMKDFAMGFIDSRQLTLLGSVIVVCLFGAARAVQAFKWR